MRHRRQQRVAQALGLALHARAFELVRQVACAPAPGRCPGPSPARGCAGRASGRAHRLETQRRPRPAARVRCPAAAPSMARRQGVGVAAGRLAVPVAQSAAARSCGDSARPGGTLATTRNACSASRARIAASQRSACASARLPASRMPLGVGAGGQLLAQRAAARAPARARRATIPPGWPAAWRAGCTTSAATRNSITASTSSTWRSPGCSAAARRRSCRRGSTGWPL